MIAATKNPKTEPTKSPQTNDIMISFLPEGFESPRGQCAPRSKKRSIRALLDIFLSRRAPPHDGKPNIGPAHIGIRELRVGEDRTIKIGSAQIGA